MSEPHWSEIRTPKEQLNFLLDKLAAVTCDIAEDTVAKEHNNEEEEN
jgi:hypothetical protein